MDKKYITKFVAYLLFLIVPAIGYAGDIEFSLPDSLQPLDFWDGGGGFIGKAAATLCPPLPALIAIPQMGLVDTLDVYQIKLTLPKGGIPFLGGVSFSFPATFDLSQISEIEYSDDYSGDDLKIRRIYIHNGIITLFFKWGKSPPAGTVITFTVHSIKNPTVAGEYQIAGLIFNKWFRVEAGPTLSDRFTIYPDKPVSIIISPSDHLALRAEETQVFTAEVHDKFGNIIEGLNINWALSADFDKIGIISDGYLFATTVGHGKVVASFENLSAMSGLITVLPGAVDHFVVSGVPQEVEAGVPFLSAVTVTAFDKFGNLKSDYIGSIYFTSSDARAVLIYNESNQYAFASSDSGRHAFDGADFTLVTAGQQTITVTDGVHSGVSAPIIISSGKIVAFNIVVINGHPLRAGDPIYLEAAGAVDRFGNPAGGKIEVRQVVGGPSPGGFQSVLNDIIVVNGKGSANQYIYAAGEAVLRASIDTVFREAELIVLPAALGTLKLDIQPTQFVGHPLFGPATLTCSDKFGNLKTDFNTLDNPIDLSVDKGELSRTRLDSADDFVNGVADLTTKNIIYSGEAGTIRLTASASPGITVSADLSYNGVSFDLVGPLPDSIYAGQTIRVDARLQNKGDLPTLPAVLFSAHLGSCPNQCAVEREISSIPPNGGSRVGAAVPSDSAPTYIYDSLTIMVNAKYRFGNDTIVSTQTHSYSIHILDKLSFSYVDGSLTVDTVLSPSLLPSLSFKIQSNRRIDIEQLRAEVSLSMKLDDSTWIQFGWPRLDTSIDDQVFIFEQSEVQIPELIVKYHTEGYKSLKAAIVFYGGADKLFRFEDSIVGFDSLYVVFASKLTYKTSSLSPVTVSGGMNHAF
ncbi:MAG: hypothetical protein NT002_03690, partial [candidate division Zixibacteria bacterium]|nr:hypothetical protein [candidate division Zixibacteria bacterium]